MKRKAILMIIILCMISLVSLTAWAEGLVTLSVKEADVRDVLKMMGEQSGINVVPDPTVTGLVTLTVNNVSVDEALEALVKAYGFNYTRVSEKVFIVGKQAIKEPYLCNVENGKLTLIAQGQDLKRVLNDISTKGKINIVYDQSVSGQVNANLIEVDVQEGLKALCTSSNLMITQRENIFNIASMMGAQAQNRQLNVSYVNGLLSVDVKNGDLSDLIRAIGDQTGFKFMLFGGNHQLVDLRVTDVPVEEVIKMLLAGTRYSFKKQGDVYLIGDKSINSPSASLLTLNEVISLKYLQAEKVPAMLPNVFPATNIKVIKELNALAVTGTQEDIDELKRYLENIDRKIPQIVVEAIILQVNRNQGDNPNNKIGMQTTLSKDGGSVLLDVLGGKLTFDSVKTLEPKFWIELERMIVEGIVTLKARPNITTLNGYQAKINVGNVQYYKVTTQNTSGQSQTQYQSINAGITLDVVPWVSSTGEITLDLHPTVSNLGGASGGDAPPQIAQRTVDTTVRVKDGQTIIIGGLIQEVKSDNIERVPILGYLPLIGKFFQKKNFTLDQTELIIYITPRILNEEQESISSEEIEQREKQMEQRYNNGN